MSFPKATVYIFGAGATRGGLEDIVFPPPPIDIDFFDIAAQLEGHGTQLLARKVLKSVWELYGRTNSISLEKYYRDIETRALIGSFAKTSTHPKDWKKRQDDLEELIRRVYIHTTCDMSKNPVAPKISKAHQEILKQINKGDTVVTFNYDLVIEEAFPKRTFWSPEKGYGVKVYGITDDWCRKWLDNREIGADIHKETLFLKLHGSLHWRLYANKNIRLKSHPYVVRTRNNRPSHEEVSILPPGWNKKIHRNPYKCLWRLARLRLEKSMGLVIIGYSLPETDLLAQALFAEIIRLRAARREYLKELHIVDPSAEVREKFVNLFLPALGPFGKIFKYRKLENFVNGIS